MNDEEKCVKIAEALGLKVISCPFKPNEIKPDRHTVFTTQASQQWALCYPRGAAVKRIANYFTNLNSMHKAENILTSNQWYEYCRHLIEGPEAAIHKAQIHASARQRAEAFGATLALWVTSLE